MKKLYIALCICIAFVLGILMPRPQPHPVIAATMNPPSQGYTLHIDATNHFPAHPNEVAHHWCKTGLPGGMAVCQLYDSDDANARLVGIEEVVPAATFNTFSSDEKPMWHYHRSEIPRVHATMPDMSADDAKKVTASLMETYGKIFVLYDPMSSNAMPMGTPSVTTAAQLPH